MGRHCALDGRVQCTDAHAAHVRHGVPLAEQRRTAIATEHAMDALAIVETPQGFFPLRDAQVGSGYLGHCRECRPVGLAATGTVAVDDGTQRAVYLVLDGAAEAGAGVHGDHCQRRAEVPESPLLSVGSVFIVRIEINDDEDTFSDVIENGHRVHEYRSDS